MTSSEHPAPARAEGWARACFLIGGCALVAAAFVWFVPWNAADSQCTLASRNRAEIRGACAAGASPRMAWFVALVVVAAALTVWGLVRRRATRRRAAGCA